MKRRKWLLTLIGVLLAALALWSAAALFLTTASAEQLPFPLSVRSRLAADYRYEGTGGFLGPFRFSMIGEALRDLGLAPGEADQQAARLAASMDDPVPTATALDFEGSAPFTPTPTVTDTPTETPTPTATPTNTRVPPTKTPVPTETKRPKKSNTPKPAGDTAAPVIADPGTLSPAPGSLGACSVTVSVSNVHITDATPSSGIDWAKLKYQVWDSDETNAFTSLIYSPPLSKCSGGAVGGGWDACYDGPAAGFTISIYPGFSSNPDYTGPGPFHVKVWLKVHDNAGHEDLHYYGIYTIPSSCDDPPATPAPPTPTDTCTPTPTATETHAAATTP